MASRMIANSIIRKGLSSCLKVKRFDAQICCRSQTFIQCPKMEVQKNKWMSTATGQHNFQDQTQKRPTPSNNSTSSASSSTLNQNKQQKHDVRECWKCHRHIERKTFFCSDCHMVQPAENNVDYFSLLDCPPSFNVNMSQVTQKFRDLQRKLHPDKFMQKTTTEKEFSAQQSAALNRAFNIIKKPELRAKYLLNMYGIRWDENQVLTDPELLTRVLELREQIEESEPEELRTIGETNKNEIESCIATIAHHFNEKKLTEVEQEIAKLQYLLRIQTRIDEKLDGLLSVSDHD